MKFTFKKAVVVAGMVLSSTLAMAQFAANMSYDAIAAEVKARKDKGESAEAIANAAKAVLSAGQAGSLVTAMLSQNLDGAAVIQSVIAAYGATDSVTTSVLGAARLAGVPEKVRNDAAILAGASTTTVLGATAAGGAPAAGGTPVAGGDTGGLGGGTSGLGAPRSSLIGNSGGSTTTTSRSPS